jgi:hypothetical protein
MQDPEEPPTPSTIVDAADLVPSVPMPMDATEAVKVGVTPHPSGLNRAQRRAAYRQHKRRKR